MADQVSPQKKDAERKLGGKLFNHTWELIEKKRRTKAEDEEMINAAHASLYHWSKSKTQTAANISIGEWQVSHVYAILGRTEPALYYALRCLEVCEENGLRDFYLAYAYEALARAYAVTGNEKESRKYFELAQKAGKEIAEKDDRELLRKDLQMIPRIKIAKN